jgi:hypothetical protein
MHKKMVRDYHECESAEEEIKKRVAYEYLFGYVNFSNIVDGSWSSKCMRDAGHHKRIVCLMKKM